MKTKPLFIVTLLMLCSCSHLDYRNQPITQKFDDGSQLREWHKNKPSQWKEWDEKHPFDGKNMVEIYDANGRLIAVGVEK